MSKFVIVKEEDFNKLNKIALHGPDYEQRIGVEMVQKYKDRGIECGELDLIIILLKEDRQYFDLKGGKKCDRAISILEKIQETCK